VQVRATSRITGPGDYYQTFVLTLSRLLLDDAGGDELREHLARPGTITCQPLL
jgi:hypothetical protein